MSFQKVRWRLLVLPFRRALQGHVKVLSPLPNHPGDVSRRGHTGRYEAEAFAPSSLELTLTRSPLRSFILAFLGSRSRFSCPPLLQRWRKLIFTVPGRRFGHEAQLKPEDKEVIPV